jgi:SulP family sulfate permease
MPLLVKLFFLSCGVTQLAFTAKSNLSFSVGLVQDVGLIFLASMTRNVVAWSDPQPGVTPPLLSDAEVVATCLWQNAIATTIVGVCVIIVGKLKMGAYVQMLPLPVVGGYLGYIGYFCFAAGLASATGKAITTPLTWYLLFDVSLIWKLSLLTLFTLILCFVHFKVHHFSGLPTVLTFLPLLFFCRCPSSAPRQRNAGKLGGFLRRSLPLQG